MRQTCALCFGVCQADDNRCIVLNINVVPRGFMPTQGGYFVLLLIACMVCALPAVALNSLPNVTDVQELPTTGYPVADARLNELLRDGSGERSVSLLEATLERYPTNWQAYVSLAYLHQKQGGMKAAELTLKRALELSPHQPLIMAELASLYMNWHNKAWLKPSAPADALPMAKSYLYQAGMLLPEDPMLALYQAEYELIANGDTTQARAYLAKGLKAAPNHVPSLLLAARLHQHMGFTQQAKEVMFFAYDLAPERPSVLDGLANLMASIDRPQQAIEYTNRAMLLDSGTAPERYLLLAQQYEKLAAPDKAYEYYSKFSQYAPVDVTLTLKQASLLEQQGLHQQAQAVFYMAYQQDATLFDDTLKQARDLINREALDAAKPVLQRAFQLNPQHTELPTLLATLYYRSMLLGKRVSAEELASAELLMMPKQVNNTYYTLNELNGTLQTPVSPHEATLNQIKFALVKTNGTLSQEQIHLLRQLKVSGSSIPIQAEAAFLLSDMRDALTLLNALPDAYSPATLMALGDRWRLMQFIPGATVAYQKAHGLRPTPTSERTIIQMEQVNQQIQHGLSPYFNPPPYPRGADTGAWVDARNLQRMKAKDQAYKAIELNPCNPLPYVLLGTIASHEKSWHQAVVLWQAVIQRETPHVDARHLNAYEEAKVALLKETRNGAIPPMLPVLVPASPGYRY
jgi:tetratricopeptide (TPR) repeat protein